MPTFNLDLDNADPEVIKEYQEIDNEIHEFSVNHPDPLNEDEHTILREMLNKRAQVLSKLLNSAVHSLFEN